MAAPCASVGTCSRTASLLVTDVGGGAVIAPAMRWARRRLSYQESKPTTTGGRYGNRNRPQRNRLRSVSRRGDRPMIPRIVLLLCGAFALFLGGGSAAALAPPGVLEYEPSYHEGGTVVLQIASAVSANPNQA